MKSYLKNKYPRLYFIYDAFFRIINVILNYMYDFKNYVKYSGTLNSSKKIFEFKIYVQCHAIEKGMSLKDRRKIFGLKNLEFLKKYLIGLSKYDPFFLSNPNFILGINTANKLIEKLPKEVLSKVTIEFFKAYDQILIKNFKLTQSYTRQEIYQKSKIDYLSFLKTRRAIREFEDGQIENSLINKAINIAKHTPSVCNRQAWRVKIVKDDLIKKTLELHNGNRGFSKYLNKIIIICVDLRAFEGSAERNQAFIDGGLFSMNLINSFHSIGIGTIPLNWSANYNRDKALKNLLKLPKSFNIIMLLGLGVIPNKFTVPISKKLTSENILFDED